MTVKRVYFGVKCVACGYPMELCQAWSSRGSSQEGHQCHCGTGVIWTIQEYGDGAHFGNRLKFDGITIDSFDGFFECADGVAIPHLVGTPCATPEEHLAIAKRLIKNKLFL